MPLIYNALESEHTIVSSGRTWEDHQDNKNFHQQVQEQALKVVPDLCDTIDYAEVQGVLFPRVAVGVLFSGLVKDRLTVRRPHHLSSFSRKRRF